jgi:hypothetical protein
MSVVIFLLNNMVLAALLYGEFLSPLISALLSAACVPPISFLASRFWAFR